MPYPVLRPVVCRWCKEVFIFRDQYCWGKTPDGKVRAMRGHAAAPASWSVPVVTDDKKLDPENPFLEEV